MGTYGALCYREIVFHLFEKKSLTPETAFQSDPYNSEGLGTLKGWEL